MTTTWPNPDGPAWIIHIQADRFVGSMRRSVTTNHLDALYRAEELRWTFPDAHFRVKEYVYIEKDET